MLHGAPIKGATIELLEPDGRTLLQSGSTDRSGSFELLVGTPPPYTLRANHDRRFVQRWIEPSAAVSALEIELAGTRLTGVVLDTQGVPRAGARVGTQAEGEVSRAGVELAAWGHATTDGRGRFEMEASCDGALSLTWADANGARQHLPLGQLERGGTLDGLVLRELPSRTFVVELRPPTGPRPRVREDRRPPSADTLGTNNSVTIELPELSQVGMRVGAFQPRAGFQHRIHVRQQLDTQYVTLATTLERPQLLVSVPHLLGQRKHRDCAAALTKPLQLGAANDTPFTIQLEYGGHLSVTVRDADRSPRRATLRLFEAGGVDLLPALPRQRRRGGLQLGPLAPGPYRIEAHGDDGAVARQEVVLGAGEWVPVALTLPRPTGR